MQMPIVMLIVMERTVMRQVREVLLTELAAWVGVGVLRWINGRAASQAQVPPSVKKMAKRRARVSL